MSQLLDRIKNLVGGLSREERQELVKYCNDTTNWFEEREKTPIPDLDLDERCPYV